METVIKINPTSQPMFCPNSSLIPNLFVIPSPHFLVKKSGNSSSISPQLLLTDKNYNGRLKC